MTQPPTYNIFYPLQERIKDLTVLLETEMDKYVNPKQYPETIWKSIYYSLANGGKRLRAVLAIESCLACKGNIELILPTAIALEMVHSQSLIHDDLPCMDNDDFRRGQPSNHKVFGEAIAILAGDGLLAYAPYIILSHTKAAPETIIRYLKRFCYQIGVHGLVGGQVVDIESEGQKIDAGTLDYIHTHKTASLFNLAAIAGPILTEQDAITLNLMEQYGNSIGLAFQIVDDVLDITADKDSLGKTPGKDLAAGKATYPLLYGMDQSKQEINTLCHKAITIVKDSSLQSDMLIKIAEYIKGMV